MRVPNKVIAADYAESQKRLLPLYEAHVARVGEENLGFWGQQTATEEMMLMLLRHIKQSYGDVENYLRQAGLTQKELNTLLARLI